MRVAMKHLPAYPLPLSESERLQALRPYQLYSTMNDESFSELVRLAAKLFRVPISIIAFVEAEQVRFGINHGLDQSLDRVNRWETLCSIAMLHDKPSIFENLHDQPCDLINPALVHQLHLGFYAGAALRTKEGFPIGVLCVIDQKARTFDPSEALVLEQLATVVMSLLDLRLHLLRQPTWNQLLWQAIYTRIEASISRLEALADQPGLCKPEDHITYADQLSASQEMLEITTVLAEQIQALHTD
jgi:GAF domain-containing protein